jgi:UDP-N-acetylglucosamine acyltransferase
MARIHATAVIDPSVELGADVEVGAFAVIGADVKIGAGTVIGPHMRIDGPAVIGERNTFTGSSSIGTDPQDLKFGGEKTRLEIGDENMIREFVTISRGTKGGGGITTIGSRCLLMAYSHIAHDCHVGSNVIFANAGTLAGHVEVGDFSTIGALSAIHQFCRVGQHAFLGGNTIVTQDALPFVKTVGARPAKSYGINTIGLERKGFSKDAIAGLKTAYRLLVRAHLRQAEALEQIEAEVGHIAEVKYFVEFVRGSQARGFVH